MQSMLKFKVADAPLYKYGLAIFFTIIAVLFTSLFWDAIDNSPFLFFIGAVALSGWLGGFGPGMFSAALGIVSIDFFLIEPINMVSTRPSDLLQFGIFSLIAFLISWLQSSRSQSEQSLLEIKNELNVILQSVADGITAQDATGSIVFANSAASKLTGYSSTDSILNKSVEDIQRKYEMFDVTGLPLPFSALPQKQVFKIGHSASLIFQMRFNDTNEEKWIDLTSSPVFDKKGNVKLAVNIFRDITEKVEDEKNRSRLASIVQNSDDAIIGKTVDRIVQSWNPGAEQLYGYSAEEVIGKPISLLFPEDIKPREMNLTKRVFAGEKIHHYETKRLHKDGHSIDISLTLSPIRDRNKNIIGYSTIERDITRRKKREIEINRLNVESEKQRRHLESIVANIPGIVYVGSGGRDAGTQTMDFISPFAEKMLGYPISEWDSVDNLWKKVVHPDDWEQAIKNADEVYESGKVGTVGFRCVTIEDKVIHVEAYSSAILDNDGQRVGTCGVVMDVTERKTAEDNLHQTRLLLESLNQRWQNIVNNVPGVVYESTIDTENNEQQYNYMSDYIEKLLGYSAQSWKTNPHFWEELIPPTDLEEALADATAAFEDGKPGRTEFRSKNSDGDLRDLESYFHFIPDGKIVKTYGVIMDITERKHAEKEITRYTEELRRSNEELEQFAYVASHDLQEPLRKISSYLQLVESRYADKLDDDGREFIDYAVDGAHRMKSLISDLLMYSRVQRNKGKFKITNIEDVVRKVVDSLEFTIEENEAEVTYDTLPEVSANEGQLSQLFQNLITNAIKFRREESPKIHISAEKHGKIWQFCVRDNGIGMESDYFERIFVIFQRLHGRTKIPRYRDWISNL